MTITRSSFEELITPLVDQTLVSVDAALRDSGLSLNNIDDLVLVGGSTRIPLVARRLSEELQLDPSRAVNPDLAVALGAATQAAMFDGYSIGPVLVDITGHTLGLEVMGGFSEFSPALVFSPIIRRNSPLPATYEEVYARTHPEQEKAEIHVLQGESSDVSRNRSIGRFMLDLETGSNISDEILVRFDLTLDGILKVTATQSATGKNQNLIIDNALSEFQGQDREQVEARLGAIFDSSEEILDDGDLPPQDWQSSSPDSTSHPSILNHEKYPAAVAMLEQCQSVSGIPDEDLDDIRSVTKQLRTAMASDDSVRVASLCEELDDILFYIQG
jgi:molecular chaperone DnaK